MFLLIIFTYFGCRLFFLNVFNFLFHLFCNKFYKFKSYKHDDYLNQFIFYLHLTSDLWACWLCYYTLFLLFSYINIITVKKALGLTIVAVTIQQNSTLQNTCMYMYVKLCWQFYDGNNFFCIFLLSSFNSLKMCHSSKDFFVNVLQV